MRKMSLSDHKWLKHAAESAAGNYIHYRVKSPDNTRPVAYAALPQAEADYAAGFIDGFLGKDLRDLPKACKGDADLDRHYASGHHHGACVEAES